MSMHAQTRNQKSIAISKKLYRSIAAVFFASIFIIVLMIFLFMRGYLLRQEQSEANRLGEQISRQLQSVFQEAEKLCDIVGKNYDVQEAVRVPVSENFALNAKERTDVNGKIALLTQSYTNNIDNIALFLEDGRCFKYGMFSYDRMEFRTQDWYQKLLVSDSFCWIGMYDTSQALHSLEWGCFVGGMNLTNMRNNEVCGVVLTEVSFSTIVQLLDEYASDGVSIELIDAINGETLHRTGKISGNWPSGDSELPLTDFFRIRIHINKIAMLDEYAQMLLLFAILGVAGALALMKFCTNQLRTSIAQPIEQLLQCVNAFEDARTEQKITIDTDIAEISRLIDGVEDLFGRIRVLLRTSEEGQKTIRRAQVAALQEQINPHFLYNTMDSISWLIRKNERDKALKTLSSFATLFRLSLNNGRNYVTIEEELTCIRHYIDILNVRYNNQISYEIETPDLKLIQSYIPKLVLQPLVENSIEHGIGMRESQSGNIRIRVLREHNGALIEIWDDGMGIEAQALEEINRLLMRAETPENKARRSYGIYNVNNRFRVAYGMEYGIAYESEYGVYTLVKMRAPLCNVKGEILHD